MNDEEKFDQIPLPLADAAMAQEMYEALQCVERWVHGEGIELAPSVRRRMNAIRAKLKSKGESYG